MKRHHLSLICLWVLCFGMDAVAADKNFKGLFGSYRREKFTENEANSNDFGVDLMLSTLLPITSVAKSSEGSSKTFNSLNYSTFFNVEASFWFTLGYNWAFYASIGKYSYETRKQNAGSSNTEPLFHKFELEAIPGVAGIRYRLSDQDLVPYVSLGVGMAYVHRQTAIEGLNKSDSEYKTVACGHGAVGLEFFFAPKAGLRVEASAYYLNLPQRTFDPQSTSFPTLQYQPNVWSMRYSSGLFFLF